ncbi:MAG: 1,4-alpha-glucan branching protein GlgB [Mariniblastus sp.]|nr:1,4-alpha-glucan branching protein GlgB [Mariniblastus sp.]
MTRHEPESAHNLVTDDDLYLLGEGNHHRLYEVLGAHPCIVDGTPGIHFAVWAPNAQSIQLIGDFNDWKGPSHELQQRQPSGVWELFVPELPLGNLYKYRITDSQGVSVDKCDPFGFAAEVPPKTANRVVDLDEYQWQDQRWMEQREHQVELDRPISVYEVHLASWQQRHGNLNGWINYRELAQQLVDYVKRNGFTHLELLPVSEHPFTASWGYQTVGYYAATSRFGSPQDFMFFVDLCHQNGISVIIDWVPGHFPKDPHGLACFDGTALYEIDDPRRGVHPDWDTLIFNYGRNEVRNFLVANALFWLDKYHIDGLRVDAVASMLYLDYSRKKGEWVPNEYGGNENLSAIQFLKELNQTIAKRFPGTLTIAEESTSWEGVSRPTDLGGLGFTLKWNMGWMNDTLTYMRNEPIHRKYHHDKLTFSLTYAFSEHFMLPLSHDEVVHEKGSMLNKMPGDRWQKFANLRLLYTYMWAHPGKKLLFMGSEFGQLEEWDFDSSLHWELLEKAPHKGLQKLVSDLNHLYANQPALYETDFDPEGFQWLNCDDDETSCLSFVRYAKRSEDFVVAMFNFTPVVRDKQRFGVPQAGTYTELFNSDSEYYYGSNSGNGSDLKAERIAWQGQPFSFELTLPPLAGVLLQKVIP